MLRLIGSIVAGIVLAVATVFVVELVGHIVYPVGETDMQDREAVAAMIAALPVGALLIVALAWLLGALVGGSLAARLSGRRWPAWVVAAVVALFALATVFMYPHPVWMQIAAFVAPALGGLIAGHLAARGRREAAAR